MMNLKKISLSLLAAVIIINISSLRAYAYLDASATTYIIQIVASIVVAAGAVIGVVIARIKKKAKETLHVDFEKKTQEEEIEIYEEKQ